VLFLFRHPVNGGECSINQNPEFRSWSGLELLYQRDLWAWTSMAGSILFWPGPCHEVSAFVAVDHDC
jgi:hypothetical protein